MILQTINENNLLDRTIWFVAGCLVGFVFGWLVRHVRETQTDLRYVKERIDLLLPRDERGAARLPSFANLALVAVVLLVAFASFQSQLTSNRVNDTQTRLANLTMCNQQFLGRTIDALNERTTYSASQATANLRLQQTQADFLSIVLIRPAPEVTKIQDALEVYFDSLTEFTTVVAQQQQKVAANPYPTEAELQSCLTNAQED